MPTDKNLEAYWDKILEHRPALRNFFANYKHKTLFEYAKLVAKSESSISEIGKNIILDLCQKFFPKKVTDNLKMTLDIQGGIDTSSHGGILSEDTLVQSQMVLASGVASNNLDTMVSLACGVVPMNNSTWPRGFFRLGKRESIFPKSFDRIAVHECPPFNQIMIEKKLKDPAIDSCTKEILDFILKTPEVFEQEKFTHQTILINYHIWSKIGQVTNIKNFIHLPLEEITAKLVINSLKSKDALSDLIFCKHSQDKFFKALAGLAGTWALDRSKGTFLFWHVNKDFRTASLWPYGEQLKSINGSFNFYPQDIIYALETKQIVPSIFTSLIVLLFYGVRPSGGYHQIFYLPEYARRIKYFVTNNEVTNCPNFLSKVSCAELIQLGYGFCFLKDDKSSTGLAGADTFLCNPISQVEFNRLVNQTTVLESAYLNTDRWYNEIVPK